MTTYPIEEIDSMDDDGTMPGSVAALGETVIGHRIVSVTQEKLVDHYWEKGLIITLDNGQKVTLADSEDCCAYTTLEAFLLNADKIDHVITGVGTTDGYRTWHIYADLGDVLELSVGWSCGNPFYYGYGFHIAVSEEKP